MKKRYDNPNKLILEHIIRPYQNWIPSYDDKRLNKNPFTNKELIEMLKEKSKWSESVLERLKCCDVRISKWVFHPVTEYLKSIEIIK